MSETKIKNFTVVVLLFSLTIIIYFNAFQSGFIGDDFFHIVDHAHILQRGFSFVMQDILPDRPLMMATIWLNYKINGIDPFGFKVVNIFLHAICGITLYFFLIYFLNIYGTTFFRIHNEKYQIKGFKLFTFNYFDLISISAAGLFIVHPINNQAVMSIIQRGVLLSMLFAVLSFHFLHLIKLL